MITVQQKEAYKQYVTSKEWYELKIDLLNIRGIKCEKCGVVKKDARQVQIHHITYARLFNELPADLIILCPKCHMKEHGIIKAKKPKPVKVKVKQIRSRGNDSRKEQSEIMLEKYRAGTISYKTYKKRVEEMWQRK